MRHDRMLWTTAKLAVVAGATAVALTGCANESKGTSTPPSIEATTSSPSSTDSAESASNDLIAAGESALRKVTKSTLISIETDSGGWEVHVVTSDGVEHEMVVAKDGSKIVRGPKTKDEDAENKAEHKDLVKKASLDFKRAAKKITTAVPGGTVTELNLDNDRGRTVWEADVIDGSSIKHEVTIDAASGKLLENRKSD